MAVQELIDGEQAGGEARLWRRVHFASPQQLCRAFACLNLP